MEKEIIIKSALKARESTDHSALLSFFSNDAVIEGYIYGTHTASDFFKIVFQDTLSIKISVSALSKDQINPNVWVVQFEYTWMLKKQTLTGSATEIWHFNSDNKIKYISTKGTVNNIENSPIGILRETIIKKGFDNLNAGNYPQVVDLFEEDATLECIYGYVTPSTCLNLFLHDTSDSQIIINKVTQDPKDQNIIIAHLEFRWTLKTGQTVKGNAVEFFTFNTKNKITYIRTMYNFIELS